MGSGKHSPSAAAQPGGVREASPSGRWGPPRVAPPIEEGAKTPPRANDDQHPGSWLRDRDRGRGWSWEDISGRRAVRVAGTEFPYRAGPPRKTSSLSAGCRGEEIPADRALARTGIRDAAEARFPRLRHGRPARRRLARRPGAKGEGSLSNVPAGHTVCRSGRGRHLGSISDATDPAHGSSAWGLPPRVAGVELGREEPGGARAALLRQDHEP